jgi:hypothetical protein
MATERSARTRIPQGLLGFDIDPTGGEEQVTALAGLPLVLETMRALRLNEAVEQFVKIRKRNSGTSEPDAIEAIVLMLAAGGECMDDIALLGADKGLLRLLEKQNLPSPDAVRQFLLAFHDEAAVIDAKRSRAPEQRAWIVPENGALMGLARVQQHLVDRVNAHRAARIATLEMDATIIESHKIDAMPHYKDGRGYQPSLAYWVEQDLIMADEFRDGNVPAGMRPLEVIRRGFEAVPETVATRRFRADSACYEIDTLRWLVDPANRIERFTVSADMSPSLRTLCENVPPQSWQLLEERAHETVQWAEVVFCPGDWPKDATPLRTLVLRVERRQLDLPASDGTASAPPRIKHLAVVSNDFAMRGDALVRWHWQKAGKVEIVHDVLKNELGASALPCAQFGANAAWFRLCLLTYNVLSAMKTLALPPALCDARPKRLRFSVFSLPARIVSHGRRLYARIAAALVASVELLAVRARLLGLVAARVPGT